MMTQKIIKVEGMSCEHCINAVESALAKLNGVSSAEVNLDEIMYALSIMIQKLHLTI